MQPQSLTFEVRGGLHFPPPSASQIAGVMESGQPSTQERECGGKEDDKAMREKCGVTILAEVCYPQTAETNPFPVLMTWLH